MHITGGHMETCQDGWSEWRYCIVVQKLSNLLRRIGCVVSCTTANAESGRVLRAGAPGHSPDFLLLGGVAEYAMSVYVCVFVCLYASISRELHIQSSLMSRMMCNLYMTVGRFSSGGVAICSCFRFTDDVIIAQNASCMSRPFQRRVTIFALSCMG